MTEEDFIRMFINDVQHWGIGNRTTYNNKLQRSFQDVIGTVFSMDNESMAGFANRASTCMDRIPALSWSGKSKRNIYASAIGSWHDLNGTDKKAYVNTITTAIDATGAYDYLIPQQKTKVRSSLPTFIDFALMIVDGDYNNKSFGDTATCMMLPTFALNAPRIMSNHYLEVNLAWLRAADSYYNNDKTAYVIGNAGNVSTPAAKVGDKELAAGENTVLAGKQSVTLDVKGLKGEAVYYKVSKGGTRLSQDTCKNGYEIYRGPFQLNLESGNTYTITAYAMSYGTKSGEVTYIVKAERTHKVTIFSEPDALRKDPPTINTYSEGTKIQLKTSQSVQTDTTTYVFSRWEIVADNSLHLNLLPDASNTNDTTFTLPASGTHSLSQNYSLTIKPLYLEKTRYDNLHDIVIQKGNGQGGFETVKNLRAREGATVRYALTIPDDKAFVSWTVKLVKSDNTEYDVAILKPITNNKWAGKNSQELRFVMPKKGDEVLYEPGHQVTFGENDRLFFKAEIVGQIGNIELGNINDPETEKHAQQQGVSYKYKDVSQLEVGNGVSSQAVKWDESVQKKTNRDMTVTTTTTYTTCIACPKPATSKFVASEASGGLTATATLTNNKTAEATKIEHMSDGSARVYLRVVKTETTGKPQYTVYLKTYDINDTEKKPLKDLDGEEIVRTSVGGEEDFPFKPTWTPGVPGGRETGEFCAPDDSGLVKQEGGTFRLRDGSTAPLTLLAGIKPVVSNVKATAFPVPKMGEELATTTDNIQVAYSTSAESVFKNNVYTPQIESESMRWIPAAPANGKAEGNTQYTCAIRLAFANAQICFAADTSASTSIDGAKSAKFVRDASDASKGTLYLTFEHTERSTDHTVTVKDNADEGDPATHTWKEGEVKTVTAKDDYADKVFSGWTVKFGDADATPEQLAAMGFTEDEDKLKQPKLAFTMPAVGDLFPEGYALSFTATYHGKADKLYVFNIEPTAVTDNLADTASLKWHWMEGEAEQTGTATVDVAWTAEAAYTETTGTHTYTATMRLDAQYARQLMREETLPEVWAQESNDLYRQGNATWNADGSLTVVVSYGPMSIPLPAYQVTIGAYDANSPTSKLRIKGEGDSLVEMSDVSQVVVNETGDTDGFTLAAPVIDGAEFVGWEIPAGAKIQRVGAQVRNKFAFTDNATAQDAILVRALYKPIVRKVTLGITAPVAEQPLVNEATAAIEIANTDAFVNVTPSVAVDSFVWTPDGTSAAYDTEYAAATTLAYKIKTVDDQGVEQVTEAPWLCGYADDVEVACDGASSTWFDVSSAAAYVFFPGTPRDDRHQASIRDFAEGDEEEGEPKQETWYEGETKYLVAKQYDDMLFTGWTITRVAENTQPTDVTTNVLLPGAQSTDVAIAIRVPPEDAQDFPEGYALTVVANYKPKVSELSITVPQPKSESIEFGEPGSASWVFGDATTTRNNVPIDWSISYTEDTSTGNKITRTAYEATLHLELTPEESATFADDPSVVAKLADGSTEDGPQIDYGEVSCERATDGLVIIVPFVSTEEEYEARTVVLQLCDVNVEGHTELDDVDDEEFIVYEDDEDGVTLWAPDVDGGMFTGWEFDKNALEKTPVTEGDETAVTFTFKQDAAVGETYTLRALYKPVVQAVCVDFAAPEAGEKLATKDDATVAYELANEAFAPIEASVSALAWAPKHTEADFGEEYRATVTCTPNEGTQYALADDLVGAYGQDLADFAIGEDDQHLVYVEFDATELRNNHKVTLIDNAYGLPTTYLWQETSTKHVVAKTSEDKLFSHWTIKDQNGTDVTRRLLQNEHVDDKVIELLLPKGSVAASLTSDYSLTITANYMNKANKLNITGLAVPTNTAANTTSNWQWSDGTSTYSAPVVDVMWTRDSKDDTYVYTATMRLDANKAQGMCHNDLAITVNGNASQTATTAWDAEGNLTVTTTFTKESSDDDAQFRTVKMIAYDVNDGEPLPVSTDPLEALLYNRSYEVLVTGGSAKLVPYQVSGGVFSNFVADNGESSAIQSVANNVVTFKSSAPASGEVDAVVHALYKPVVNSVRVVVATPAHEASLATSTDTASATCANTAFEKPGSVVSNVLLWNPPDTSVDEAKEYEATVGLGYTKDVGGEDWQYVYSPDVNASTAWPAYITFDAAVSKAYLYFDESSPTQVLSVNPVENVRTTYDKNNATDIKELLDAQRMTATVVKTDNSEENRSITWEKPVCDVDGGKLEGAVWHARGKIGSVVPAAGSDPADEYANLYAYVTVYVAPATTLNLVHVDQPADICGLQAGADEATVRDQLPTQTDLILEEGVITTGDITWTKVECVDAEGNFRYSAKWTATGTVTLPADESVVNPNNVSLAVTMDIYVDLPDEIDNKAEMPYALPEDDVFDFEKDIILATDEPDGVVYYRIVSDITSTDYPTTEFAEFTGYPIYLENETVSETGILCIEAYTVAPNKEQSDVATFVYELNNTVAIPEGDELLFDGTEQVGVWGMDGYTLTKPSSGASIDEGGSACATNVGTYTVVAKVDKNRSWYVGWDDDADNPTASTNDQTITFRIVPNSINNCTIEMPASAPYTGSAVTPKPVIKLGDYVAVEGRDYTLTYENNVTVGKARVIITGKGNLKDSVTREFMVDGGDSLAITYAGHVQTYGDIPAVQNGATLGTVGQSKRIESFTATVTGASVEYRAHVQRQGWDEDWKRDGELCGTTGQSKRVEAIQVRLSDRQTEAGYHVWYRVHAQNYGWLGWACDGAPAGTSGQSKRLEAIEMVVLKGDAKPEGYDASKTSFNGRVSANAHVQTYGWLGYKSAGKFGTTGKSKRMEAFWLKPDGVPDCGVEYQSHVQRQGWETDWHANGDISGTMGKRRRVEAVRIRLTGEAAKNLSIWYRVHSQTFGWSGWARDGQDAGTAGYSKRVESIEVVVLSKDAAAPGSTENALRSR
ncbi:MAG: hypothetical protein Q4A01_01215 [Coriobacteriales bacterium]|nr:hypothetical protein [Coriobacteriales bacterium]